MLRYDSGANMAAVVFRVSPFGLLIQRVLSLRAAPGVEHQRDSFSFTYFFFKFCP